MPTRKYEICFNMYDEKRTPQKSIKIELAAVGNSPDTSQPTIRITDRDTNFSANMSLPKIDYTLLQHTLAELQDRCDAELIQKAINSVISLLFPTK